MSILISLTPFSFHRPHGFLLLTVGKWTRYFKTAFVFGVLTTYPKCKINIHVFGIGPYFFPSFPNDTPESVFKLWPLLAAFARFGFVGNTSGPLKIFFKKMVAHDVNTSWYFSIFIGRVVCRDGSRLLNRCRRSSRSLENVRPSERLRICRAFRNSTFGGNTALANALRGLDVCLRRRLNWSRNYLSVLRRWRASGSGGTLCSLGMRHDSPYMLYFWHHISRFDRGCDGCHGIFCLFCEGARRWCISFRIRLLNPYVGCR